MTQPTSHLETADAGARPSPASASTSDVVKHVTDTRSVFALRVHPSTETCEQC